MAGLKDLDKWRDFFRSCDSSDIFEIIDHAMKVAACDCPTEFKLRRGQIAEALFSCKMIKCVGCDHVELGVKSNGDEECKIDSGFEFEGGRSKESKVDGCGDDHDDDDGVDGDDHQMNDQIGNHVSFGDAEALTDEIEKKAQIHREVLRIKEILGNSEDEPISSLLDLLRRLELMVLSVETLKATGIGKTVNVLRKHRSKDIRQLAHTLIEGWKVLVDEWVNATATATATVAGAPDGATPESLNPSSVVDEDYGLPSPPLDDLAFFATQPTTMELSRFFDGLEDEENPEHYTDLNEKKETGRKHAENNRIVKQKPRVPAESIALKDKKNEQSRTPDASLSKQVAPFKPKLPVADTRAVRPAKLSMDQKVHTETRLQQKPEKVAIQRPPMTQQNKPRCLDEASVQVKLEATKRKLQERYQQAENAKRQRTIQVMELRDLPKQDLGHKNFHGKPGNNHKRNWANGRR
ncbi:putative mediator of RNA polymerase II transcription subunit 26b [Apium graveolens]|uniref:putative mediator of RNA polymerase II transcription subunit 26b n=1 Tax=Apium graveolens TaxID=4045 RepID=UPI003D7A2814